jgi:hypothetical protein
VISEYAKIIKIMRTILLRSAVFPVLFFWLAGCKKSTVIDFRAIGERIGRAIGAANADSKVAGEKTQAVKDPIQDEIYAFSVMTRNDYNSQRFDNLEKKASNLRETKQLFGNGSWKIVEFYESLACRHDEPESMWQLHDSIHRNWIAAKPLSITAHVAYAGFLVEYAWHARGSGYIDTVTEDGWLLFRERLSLGRKVLNDARALPEKDPVWWSVALTCALGQNAPKSTFDALVEEAHAYEPKFWGYDTQRAYSLLPRWHGKPGDWEAYAELASSRPDGLGEETYARVVIGMSSYYKNIFSESKASWQLTRSGLAQMREKYPDAIEFVKLTAWLATLAGDRALAKEMRDQLGDKHPPEFSGKPATLAQGITPVVVAQPQPAKRDSNDPEIQRMPKGWLPPGVQKR